MYIDDKLSDIGYSAFRGCEGLKDKNDFVIINKILFDYCGSNETIRIPNGVTRIAGEALTENFYIVSVTIPDSVTEIGENAFSFSGKLTTVKIPDSVTSIGDWAFQECSSLNTITIPDSVTSIGDNAFFSYCTPMHITIKGKKGSYAQTYAKQKDIPFKVVTLPIANKSSLSADSIVLGKTVTVHCAAKEGTAPYTYAVYYRKAGTDKWSAAQGYNTNATVSIKPAAAADYEIRVIAKDAKGNISRKDMTLTVKKPFTNTSKLNFDTIKLGEKVKIRCFAENGEAPYIFSVQYKKTTTDKWSNVAVNSTNNIFVIKPGTAASYDIRVTAKSADGQVAKKTLTLKVTK